MAAAASDSRVRSGRWALLALGTLVALCTPAQAFDGFGAGGGVRGGGYGAERAFSGGEGFNARGGYASGFGGYGQAIRRGRDGFLGGAGRDFYGSVFPLIGAEGYRYGAERSFTGAERPYAGAERRFYGAEGLGVWRGRGGFGSPTFDRSFGSVTFYGDAPVPYGGSVTFGLPGGVPGVYPGIGGGAASSFVVIGADGRLTMPGAENLRTRPVGGAHVIDVAAERLDRRPLPAGGVEILRHGSAKIIRIGPPREAAAAPKRLRVAEAKPEAQAAPRPYQPPVRRAVLEPWSDGWARFCARTQPSFDPGRGTYVTADGATRFCTGE